MPNEIALGPYYPISEDLTTITVGGERTSLEISKVDKGARIRGDLEVTGNIKGSITATDLTLDDIKADDITCHDILMEDGQLDIQHDRSGIKSLFKVESGTEAGDGTYTGAKIATDGNSLWTSEGGLTFLMTNNNDLNFDDVIIFENDGDRGAYISTDCNITNTSSNSFYGCKIDLDKTGASTSNNTIFGIDLDMDNTTATSGTNTMYGIRNTPTLTHAADAGTPSIYGLMQTVTGHTNGGAVGTGIFNVVTGSDTNRGIHQRVDDTGIDIILESSANASDECQISTTTNGATKIETIDADAALAHFTLDIDGNILLRPTPGGAITLQENDGTAWTPSASSDATTKTYVDTSYHICIRKRFYVNASTTNYYYEQGIDYADSMAKWDDSDGDPTDLAGRDLPCSYITPYAVKLKGFTAISYSSSLGATQGHNISLWHGTPTLNSASNTTLASAVNTDSSNNTRNQPESITGTCDVSLSAGDVVIPMVKRNGISTQGIFGTITFYMERA